MLRTALVTVALIVTGASCLAAEQAAPEEGKTPPSSAAPEVSPEAVAIAERIIEITGAKNRSLQMADAMIPMAIGMIKKQSPNIPDDILEMFKAAFHNEVEKSLPDLLHAEAQLYAMHYTAAELNGLLAFYQTALGQKVLAEQPKILAEIVPLGQAWGREMGERAVEAAIESLRQKGVKI